MLAERVRAFAALASLLLHSVPVPLLPVSKGHPISLPDSKPELFLTFHPSAQLQKWILSAGWQRVGMLLVLETTDWAPFQG